MAKNDASLSTGKGATCTAENTNAHKLMAMGNQPKVGKGSPTTKA